MRRRAAHWITNVKQGGRPEAAKLDEELAALALRSATAVEADLRASTFSSEATANPMCSR